MRRDGVGDVMRPTGRQSRAVRTVMPLLGGLLVVCACTGGDDSPEPSPQPTPSRTDSGSPSPAPSPSAIAVPNTTVSPTSRPVAAEFDVRNVVDVIEHLAVRIGPREAASPAFDQAVEYVSAELRSFGYEISTVPVPVPAGDSWGVPVDGGESANVIADTPNVNPNQPHVVIGAHLDTVAVAPGAEDNASGVAVLLELARMAAVEPPEVPVRFIAFGAEEPRGEGDDLHHFGSQQYVAGLSSAQRDAITAMVALDRVGVRAAEVPVCTGGTGTVDVRDALIEAAGRIDVPVQSCEDRASDHWSFEKADIPSARLGSVPYAAYHSAEDLPNVVDSGELERVGTIVWEWLTTRA